jgi:glycosyltransferase involved in cell wall biosynthesis
MKTDQAKPSSATPEPSVAIIVPAHQAAATIERCLAAIRNAGFKRDETLVVDDGSTDGTGDLVRALGVRMVRNEVPLRPAQARNRGAAMTQSDLIVFVDADVVIHPGARDRIVQHFLGDAGLTAVFGSYDQAPDSQRPVSRYRNLLHHHVHQMSVGDVSTFWTGFGATRRAAFVEAGGFDSAWENIEDVELGLRMSDQGGRILLDGDLLCKHLKDWTLAGMSRVDLWGRAVPWSRLILLGRTGVGTLNLALGHRISAVAVAACGLSLALAVVDIRFLWLALTAFFIFLASNARFFRLLFALGGMSLLLPSVAYHGLHYSVALLGYAWVRLFDGKPVGS